MKMLNKIYKSVANRFVAMVIRFSDANGSKCTSKGVHLVMVELPKEFQEFQFQNIISQVR